MTEPLLQAEPALADLAEQFEQWRQTRATAQERIPQLLWDQAVVLTTVLPRSQVAKRLRLSPTDLKKHCLTRQGSRVAEAAAPHPGFVEVMPAGFETPAVPQAAGSRSNARMGSGCGYSIRRRHRWRWYCGRFSRGHHVATDPAEPDFCGPGPGRFS